MFKGVLSKMRTELNQSLTYFLELGDDFLISDYLINKEIRLKFLGFSCLKCSSKEEIFRQGHCKKCFFESPSTAEWVIRPELSKAHLNIQDRDIDYEIYTWNTHRNNKLRVGDLFIYRVPKKVSHNKQFYFFGAGKIESIFYPDKNDPQFQNEGDICARISNSIHFENPIYESDLNPTDLRSSRENWT